MKSKIKALKGKMSRLEYFTNGYKHSIHGTVKSLFIVCFNFQVNGGKEIKIRFENCDKITEL